TSSMAQPGRPTRTPAPIDRPLGKAYLREFHGWSTAYPPGISDPTSLRHLETVQLTRECAVLVRPALRSVFEENVWLTDSGLSRMVGGFEHFFLNSGERALLFAAREGGMVVFKIAVPNEDSGRFSLYDVDDSDYGFDVPQGVNELN